MRKHSIRLRYTAIFALILGAVIALSILMNNLLLERYYMYNKVQDMVDAYDELDGLMRDPQVWADYLRYKREMSMSQVFPPVMGMLDELLGNDQESIKEDKLTSYVNSLQIESGITTLLISGDEYIAGSGNDAKWLLKLFSDIQFDNNEKDNRTAVLRKNDYYSIITTYDNSMKTNYMVCYGSFSNDALFMMRTPIISIKESALISNRFYIYIGIGAVIFGTILMFAVMGRVTKPIITLSQISKSMSNLDFEARYTGSSKDEIGELGNNMNEVSATLEKTIAELKTVNIELQRDIDAKNNMARERSEFVANVSHELKTPIALIQGYAEGLMDGVADDPESTAYYCEVIADEANKMNRMVKKLLSLNQLEFGSDQLEMSRFDLTQLVRGVVDASSILARQKDAVIVFNQEEPVYVWADEYRIEEVISNYISNAIHYVSGKNIINITISTEDGHSKVSVFNTGNGIPDEDIDKIWDKFYKVDKARTREYGGNGIGLSIVKAVMELHGGSYGAYNGDGGVTFWMQL